MKTSFARKFGHGKTRKAVKTILAIKREIFHRNTHIHKPNFRVFSKIFLARKKSEYT